MQRSRPDGLLVTEFHKQWSGAYDKLERQHGFIQWLFPTAEASNYNSQAQRLTTHEAAAIRANPACQARVRTSLVLILDFWGVELRNDDTLVRTSNYAERYNNLRGQNNHNYLRITRVIKSVGELGLERFQEAIVGYFAEEICEKGALQNCERSLRDYWFPVVRDADARARLSARFAALAPAEDADGESASGEEDDASADRSMPPLPPADLGIGDVATRGPKRPKPSEL